MMCDHVTNVKGADYQRIVDEFGVFLSIAKGAP
jgi:hypothetical protein